MLLNSFCSSLKHVPTICFRTNGHQLSMLRQPLLQEFSFYPKNITFHHYHRVKPISWPLFQNWIQSVKQPKIPSKHNLSSSSSPNPTEENPEKPEPPNPQARSSPPNPQARSSPPDKSKSSTNSDSKGGFRQKWLLEQLSTGFLLFLIPAVFLVENKELEMATVLILFYHTTHGIFSVIEDYLQAEVVGGVLPSLVKIVAILITVASLIGCYKLIYDDIGLGNTIKNFWAIKGNSD